ncbi:MAG: 50S ribosomal protein L1 [Actinobacteria bacterium]|nr:50S ribosomal protein L1 [Actinomycetota bacterium]
MSKQSKRYKEAKRAVEVGRVYSVGEAVRLIQSMQAATFDETVEVHVKLGVNPRHADQQVRGTIMLPHGTGKSVRVAVFAKGDKATEAETAGADVVGAEDLATRVEQGFLEFDVAIATPDMMGVVGKLGRVLGPRGLMPNPKAGTVTFDVGRAVADMKAGKIEYRTDKLGVVHVIIGKKSFDQAQLVENYAEFLDELVRAKPASAKGKYLRSITFASTMGPGVPVDTTKTKIVVADEVVDETADADETVEADVTAEVVE